jgi:hypothetical protein
MHTLSPLSHIHTTDLLFGLLHDLQAAACDCDDAALAEIAIDAAQDIADAIRDQGEAETGPLYDGCDDDYDDTHELDCDDLASADEVM